MDAERCEVADQLRLVMPPLASALIGALGWRGAYVALGGGVAVIGVAMALLIDNDPRDRGLGPDGAALPPKRESEPPPGTPRRDAVRSRPFLGLYAACAIVAAIDGPAAYLGARAHASGSTPVATRHRDPML
jgi:hypothetical protein